MWTQKRRQATGWKFTALWTELFWRKRGSERPRPQEPCQTMAQQYGKGEATPNIDQMIKTGCGS
eukprot:10048450-Prorocentrum_lima.AAC.1